jgi:hypothetical protein
VGGVEEAVAADGTGLVSCRYNYGCFRGPMLERERRFPEGFAGVKGGGREGRKEDGT